ncbi:hypothetical protein UFOVP257_171 [uncultured Caudovirales phage]|uniref:Uncharacterized protein n=1 Tax=uncultured Caudovirales phage TaxID=2100421 RepID=A0A6J5LGX1_9CAUD|nr:hypothetical protein UFOVP257_171 [uncultured Caudovirales phage]
MGVQNPNSTSYVHPDEPNLLNLHKAMVYRDDEPHLRVTLGTDNITITGNVNLVDSVRVNNTESQMIPMYIVGNVLTVNQGTTPWYANANVIGNIAGITTLPGITGNVGVSGNVSITQMPAINGNVWVDGITGNIYAITQLPAITGNVGVSGNVEISRMPGVTGNVGVSGNVKIEQMPGITGNVGVSGNVKIEQMPAVTGNVGVSGNVDITRMPSITGNVQIWDGGNSITVDGNVSITQMPAVTIAGNVTMVTDANIPPQISYADTVQMDSTNRLRVSTIGQQWWYVPSVDKDGDLRIVEKFTGNNTATSTFIQNLASVRMTSGQYYSANVQLTGAAYRASRRRHKTRPGVTNEWQAIVNWDGLQLNVVKRIGMFTNYNGFLFEANSTHINTVVRRRLTDGTLQEDRTPHTAWNKDNMDGTGPTGYNWLTDTITANVTSVVSQANVAISGDGKIYQVTYQLPAGEETRIAVGQKVTLTGLSPTRFNDTGLVTSIDTVNHRSNVAYVEYPGTYSSATNALMTHTPFHHMHNYWFDFNGSRTGRVRFGLHTDAGKICVHEELLGELGTQLVSAPALMDRKEIVNTGQPVGFLPSLTVGGSGVTIETTAELNPGFGSASITTPIVFNKNTNVGAEFAIIGAGIRIGEPYQRIDLQVNQVQMVDLGNLNPQNAGIFRWRLVLNPTPSIAPTTSNVGKATRQLTYAAGTTLAGGITLLTGYAQGTWTGDVKTALNFLNMGSNIDYTDTDVVVLAVTLLVGGTDHSSVVGVINYTEDL